MSCSPAKTSTIASRPHRASAVSPTAGPAPMASPNTQSGGGGPEAQALAASETVQTVPAPATPAPGAHAPSHAPSNASHLDLPCPSDSPWGCGSALVAAIRGELPSTRSLPVSSNLLRPTTMCACAGVQEKFEVPAHLDRRLGDAPLRAQRQIGLLRLLRRPRFTRGAS